MLAAFARASGSSQRARLAASALTRRVSSAAEPISSASSNSAALARSTRLFSRSFASADGGSASKLNAAPARPPVKQLPAQTTRSEERELSEAEARFIETLQYMDGVRAKSKTATQQLASKKAPSGGAASGSGKGGAAGGASGSSNNDDPPPVPVAGEKYKGKMTKHLFARRKSLEDYPGATEMVVPVDNILSDFRLLSAKSGKTAAEAGKRAEIYGGGIRALSVAHLQAVQEGREVTLEALLRAEADRDNSAVWRVVAWNTIFGQPDEGVQALTEEEHALAFLETHYGVGPIKAKKYYDLGLRTTEDLATSELVEKATRIGARYHADIIQYIPRAESIEWRERISNIIADLNTGLQWELVGSYRRGVPLSSDLDVICWHPEVDGHKGHEERVKELLDSLVDRMLSEGLLVEPLAHGPRAWRGLARAPSDKEGVLKPARRIDINFTINPAFAMLSKTGNTNLMVALRQRAIDMGMKLNEYGLWPPDAKQPDGEKKKRKKDATEESEPGVDEGVDEIQPPPPAQPLLPEWGLLQATSEQEVFEFLGLTYLEPEQRRADNYHSWLRQQPAPPVVKLS